MSDSFKPRFVSTNYRGTSVIFDRDKTKIAPFANRESAENMADLLNAGEFSEDGLRFYEITVIPE